MKKRKSLKHLIFTMGTLLIGLLFLGQYIYCKSESSKIREYHFTGNKLDATQDGLCLSFQVEKKWTDETFHSDKPKGAQYNGILFNNSKFLFEDWTLDMSFSEDLVIDSSWNGTFTSQGNQVYFVAVDIPAKVNKHSYATFGSVMYAKNLLKLQECTLKGYRIIKMQDQLLFNILVVVTIIWIIIGIVETIIGFQTNKYKRRQLLDSAIIKQSMNTFIGFIDAKDAYTRGHSARVAEYACEIARRLSMKEQDVENLYYITLMHDCGKIGIPDSVLKKPGKLTNDEYNMIKTHTTLGDKIQENITAIDGIREGAHYHHERYDGGGYPDGLAEREIPLYARIICVADSYDAMSTDRCYRTHLSNDQILHELTENAGKQFDSELVKIMIEMINDGYTGRIIEKYSADHIEEV